MPRPTDPTHLPSDASELGWLPHIVFLEDTRHHFIISLKACTIADRKQFSSLWETVQSK